MVIEPALLVKWTAIWIAILTVLVVVIDKSKWEKQGKYVFALFAIPILLSTFYMAGHTIYKNTLSETKGPVHWHADYDIYICGIQDENRLDLIDPVGFKNKVGSPLFHEHDDHRIHVEGSVKSVEDVNVGAYFKIVGGEISDNTLTYNDQNKGLVTYSNGELCDNGEPGELGVYVNGARISNVADYMYYPHASVPPGDCIIVLFDSELPENLYGEEYKDIICPFWKSAGWNFDNFKEGRASNKNYAPTWRNENWEYIDGEGMVKTGGNE
jgi:hypothetical protein